MRDHEMISDAENMMRDGKDTATEALGDMGRATTEAVDGRRRAAADSLASAAKKLHHTADHLPGVQQLSNLTHGAANRLGGAAEYLREHDSRDMLDGVQDLVRKHPGKSLAVAAVVGFLTARAMRDE